MCVWAAKQIGHVLGGIQWWEWPVYHPIYKEDGAADRKDTGMVRWSA